MFLLHICLWNINKDEQTHETISKFLLSPTVLPQQLWITNGSSDLRVYQIETVSELQLQGCIVFDQPGLQCLWLGFSFSLLYLAPISADFQMINPQPANVVYGRTGPCRTDHFLCYLCVQ